MGFSHKLAGHQIQGHRGNPHISGDVRWAPPVCENNAHNT